MKTVHSIIAITVVVFAFTGCETERRGTTTNEPAPSASAEHVDCRTLKCDKTHEGKPCFNSSSQMTMVCYQCVWVEAAAIGSFTNRNCK